MTRKPSRAKVGVIGLGIIGSRVAACLRAAGHQVYVWNRSPRAEPHFLGSAAEVAELSDMLQIFVSDDDALLKTIRAVASVLGPRHLVAGHATVAPDTAREAAALVQERGARYLDAPFTGSKVAAQSGQLVYYVAASEAALREARPVLEASAKTIVPIGGTAGQAAVVKLATNSLIANTVQGLAEAFALARAAGVDPAQFAEALENSPARSGITDGKLPGMMKGNYEPHFALKHLFKDLGLALHLAAAHGVTLPATATVAATAYGGVQRGWGEQDCSVLAKNYEPPPTTPAASPELPALPAPPPTAIEAERPPEQEPAPEMTGSPLPVTPQQPPTAGDVTPPAPEPPATLAAPALEKTPDPAANETPVPLETADPAPPPKSNSLPAETVSPPAKPSTDSAAEISPGSSPAAAVEKPGPARSPTHAVLPPARRSHAPPITTRAPTPPAFPFAPPAPRAHVSAEQPVPAAAGNQEDKKSDAEKPPDALPKVAPRRSLFAALFGRDK